VWDTLIMSCPPWPRHHPEALDDQTKIVGGRIRRP
jgi:hypothetical protein